METDFPTLPGYSVIALAGQGGMGTVYKAEQVSPHRSVAIKVLSGASIGAAELVAFRREAQVIAQLEHPRIVPLYDFGECAGRPYLVLRYLGGGSVAARLKSGPLDLATAARWLGGIAAALDFAHQKQVLHRDIKPSNILLDAAGNAYLTDFGIAGTLTQAAASSPTGSAAYMSPEQGRGDVVDGRADIYALAVTFFEMLTGQKPYRAETALGLIVRHINDPIPSARALNPAIPPAVDQLIQWGMAKNPADRPQSAAEFGQLLQQALASPNAPLPPRAAVAPPTLVGAGPTVVARPRRTSPWVWIGGFIAVGVCLLGGLVAGGGVFTALWFAPPASATPRPPTDLPPTLAPTVVPTPEGQLLVDDFSDPHSGFAVEDDPDGGVAYVADSLHITVRTSGIEWFSPSTRVQAVETAIEVDVELLSGASNGEIAVICRWQDARNYTAFAIQSEGHYSIWQNQGSEKPTLLKDGPAAPALQPGVVHHLQAICSGSALSFAADGELLGEATDPNPIAGDVALMAGLREPGQLEVAFSHLVVTRP